MAEAPVNIPINIETGSAVAQIKQLQSAISSFHSSMAGAGKAASAELANMQQGLVNNINALGGGNSFASRIVKVRSETEAFTRSLERNDFTMRQLFRNAAGSIGGFGKTFKQEFDIIDNVASSRVRTLQTQFINLGRDASGAMRAIQVRPLALDMSDFGTRSQMAAQKMQIFNESVKQGATQLLNWGKNTQWAGRQLMVGFTIPLTMMGAAAAKAFMELEKQTIAFKRVYGDLNTTVEQTNAAAEEVKQLAVNFTQYGVSLQDTMALAAKAAAMGKVGADLMAQVSETTRLAVLGQVDNQQALETTISLTNAFGTAAEELAGKIDFLNAVENQTVTSIEDLTVAIPKAGPVIQQLGGDVEDLTFFLTAMREGGINASEGANALKSGLAALINPTGKAKEMLEGFGINIENIVNSNKGDVKGLVLDFASALDTLDPLDRARAIEQLFGKFQFSRLSTLFQNVIGEGTQAQRVLELANASSQELAMLSKRELDKVAQSTTYKFEKAMADFQATLAPVGEQFLKAIIPLIEAGTKILTMFNSWNDGAKSFVTNLTIYVLGAVPIVVMMIGLFANFGSFVINLVRKVATFFMMAQTGFKATAGGVNYMTQAELEAEAMAGSLDQAHARLTQRFDIQNDAMMALIGTYENLIAKQGQLMGMSNLPGGVATDDGRIGNFKEARKTPTTFSVSGGSFEQKTYAGNALMGPGNNAQGFGIDKEWLRTSQEAVASWRGAIIAGVNTSQTGQKFNEAATPLLDELLTTYRSGIDGAASVADIGRSTYPEMKKQLAEAVKEGRVTLREAARINNSLRMIVAPTGRQMTQYTSAPRYEGGVAPDGSTFMKRAGVTERAGKSLKTANIKETNAQRLAMGMSPMVTGATGYQYAHLSDSGSRGTVNQEPRIRTQEGSLGAASAEMVRKTLESGGTVKQGQIIINANDATVVDKSPSKTQDLDSQAGKNELDMQQKPQTLVDRLQAKAATARAKRARRIVGNTQYKEDMNIWKQSGMKETVPVGQKIASGISNMSKNIQNTVRSSYEKLALDTQVLKTQVIDKVNSVKTTITSLAQRAKTELTPAFQEFAGEMQVIKKIASDKIKVVADNLKSTFDKAKNFVTPALQKLQDDALMIKMKIAEKVGSAAKVVATTFDKVKIFVAPAIQKLQDDALMLKMTIAEKYNLAVRTATTALEKAKVFVTPAIQKLSDDALMLKLTISEGYNKVITAVGTTFDKAKTFVTPAVQKLADDVMLLKAQVQAKIAPVAKVIATTFEKAKTFIAPALQKLADDAALMKMQVSQKLQVVQQSVKAASTVVKTKAGGILQPLVDSAKALTGSITQKVKPATTAISSAATKMKAGFSSLMNKIVDAAKRTAADVVAKTKAAQLATQQMLTGVYPAPVPGMKPARGDKAAKPNRQDYAGARPTMGQRFQGMKGRFQENRGKLAGVGMGVGMGLSGAAMLADMGGNKKLAEGLNVAGTIAMAVSSITMLIPMIQTFATGLAAVIGVSVGAVAAVLSIVAVIGVLAFMAWQHSENMKKVAKESKASTDAMGASTSAMKKMAEAQGKVLPSDIIAQQRQDAVAGITREEPGKETFGETYMTSEAGKSITESVKKATSSGLEGGFKSTSIAQQLASGIANGLISADEANSIADALGAEVNDMTLSPEIKSKLTELIGPDGKDALANGLDMQVRLIQDVTDSANNGAMPTLIENQDDAISAQGGRRFGGIKPTSTDVTVSGEQEAAALGVQASILGQRVAIVQQSFAQLELAYQEGEIDLETYNERRATLLEEGNKAYQANADDLAALTDAQRTSISTTLGDSLTEKFKGTPEEAAGNLAIANANSLSTTAQVQIKTSLETGTLTPTAFNNLFGAFGGNEATIQKALDLDVKFGPGTSEMLGQLTPWMGEAGTNAIVEFMATADTEDAQAALDLLTTTLEDPSLNGEAKEAMVKYYSENAEESLALIETFTSYPDGLLKNMSTAYAETGYDSMAFLYNGFASLPDAQKKTFITEFVEMQTKIIQTATSAAGAARMTADNASRIIGNASRAVAAANSMSGSTSPKLPGPKPALDKDDGGGGGGGAGGGSSEPPKDKQLEKLEGQKEYVDKNLSVVKLKEEEINKTYDKRKEALQKIADLNKQIAEQQKDQLTLADALSKGDISAAARAMQQYKANSAQRAQDMQMDALEKNRQNDISSIMVNGKSQSQWEELLAAINMSIAMRELETAKKPAGMSMGGIVKGYAMGGMVRGYAPGGFVSPFKPMGTDTVPAMLTPGEFVVNKPAVDKVGLGKLRQINSGAGGSESVYNYDITVNAGYGANGEEIASLVMKEIKRKDAYEIRGNKVK